MPGNKAQAFEKVIRNMSNIFHTVGMGMLLILMLLDSADVLGRYLFAKPITGTLEISQMLLASMVFFSWAYTQVIKGHVNIDIVVSRFSPRVQAIINVIATFLGLVLFILIAWQGAVLAKQYAGEGRLIAGVVKWPLAPFQAFISLGALAICLVFISQIFQLIPQMKRRGLD